MSFDPFQPCQKQAWGMKRGSPGHAFHMCLFHGFWFCFLGDSSWSTANSAHFSWLEVLFWP